MLKYLPSEFRLDLERQGPETLLRLQKECTRMITDGLSKFPDRFVTRTHFLADKFFNRRDLAMSYANYNNAICTDLKVQLQEWPIGIKFATPSSISTMGEIKTLHRALNTGECTWVAMNRSEQVDLAGKQKGIPAKKWATRSDKGKKQGLHSGKHSRDKENVGSSEDSDNNDDQHPKKKPRQRGNLAKKLPPMPRNCSVNGSDDDN